MSDYLELAKKAVRAAGPYVATCFREGMTARRKSAHELLSDTDVEAERLIVEAIHAECPDHEILGEESHKGDASAEHLWVIDPVDGTSNFLHGVPHFGISVAYLHRGVPMAGVILHPVLDELYEARRGGGAFLNGERLRVSGVESMADALGVTGFPYERGEVMEATLETIRACFGRGVHGVRRFGAASLDLCYVAAGRFDFYFEYDLKPWDFAAGGLIVEEAGGVVSTPGGEAMPVERSGLLASNGHLHEEVLGVLREFLPASGAGA